MSFREWTQKNQERNLAKLTPQQIEKAERRWRKMRARGMAFFLVTRTSAMFVWICVCLITFSYFNHTLKVVRQAFYLESGLPSILILSLCFSVGTWVVTRMNARNLSRLRAEGRI